MKIIESCGECKHSSYSSQDKNILCLRMHPAREIVPSVAFPDWCPLESLDDKMREAWYASHKATMDVLGTYDFHHKKMTYEEWRKQNERS